MPVKVAIRDLRKHYGAIEAVRGVSFEVHDGEIFGLLGPNGAGKTTTVECLLGLREPDAGEIEVCGIDARRRPAEAKRRMGAALQATSLQDTITPREAVQLFAALYGTRTDPEALLERFALTEKADAAFDTLSGGQRQRLALALAFINDPEVVVLDEPTSGLDPQSRRELHREIERMREDERTVLLTTHSMDEAERLCDRVAIIDRGRIIAIGSPRELIASSRAMASVSLVATQPLESEWLAGLPGAQQVVYDGATARFSTTDVSGTLAALLHVLAARGVELTELHVQKATLEDVFLELTAAGARE
jgi:ABC-2 type transport system ATP-binding protein